MPDKEPSVFESTHLSVALRTYFNDQVAVVHPVSEAGDVQRRVSLEVISCKFINFDFIACAHARFNRAASG